MVDEGATIEDIRYGGINSGLPDADIGGLEQFKSNPLEKIDLVRALAPSNAMYKEGKIKSKKDKKVYELKKLFVKYVAHYADKWDAMSNYPKQVKQKPAWFDLALSKFNDNEISPDDRRKLKLAFTTLWEFRDRSLPDRMMSEEESNRQYGIKSPYYEQPENMVTLESSPDTTASMGDILTAPQEDYSQSPVYTEEPVASQYDNDFGVRKIIPSGDSYLSRYIIPARKTNVTPATNPSLKSPQGAFTTMGVTQSEKNIGGSGSGAFNIGKNIFLDLRGKDSLENIINQRKPALPVQPVQITPDETITVAQQPQIMQRKQKKLLPSVNRKISSNGLSKFRNIELPSIPRSKMSITISKPIKKYEGFKIPSGNSKSKFNLNNVSSTKSSFKIDKKSVGNMSHDIRNNVGGVVGSINRLKQQVRGEFKNDSMLKSINIKNIKSNKLKSHKDLNILNKLKSEAHAQVSREALECKMIPKLKAQCDKVFTKNHITNEVSKFRNEFKDISKMVPVVKGDRAKITEVSMLGKSITHGVDGAHVDDVRSMYKNSGTTKQMNIGMMEYDYSFVTGKKKPKIPVEYYEEDE